MVGFTTTEAGCKVLPVCMFPLEQKPTSNSSVKTAAEFLQRLSNKRPRWRLKLGCCIDFFVDKDGPAGK